MLSLRDKLAGALLRAGQVLRSKERAKAVGKLRDALALNEIPGLVHMDEINAATARIGSMTSSTEAQALVYLAALAPAKGDVVEIGSWLGYSTIHLAMGCRWRGEGVVHAIDHFRGAPGREDEYHAPLASGETILERFRKHLKLAGIENLVRMHDADSGAARSEIASPIRLLFVDGCHEHEAVCRDLELYCDLLPSGGWVACHDFCLQFPGAIRAIKEKLVAGGGYERFFLTQRLFVACKR